MEQDQDLPRRRIIEGALALIAVGVLLGLALQALLPFLGTFLWTAILAVASWPLVAALQRRPGLGRVTAAALVATLHVLLLALPLLYLSLAVVEAGEEAAAVLARVLASGLPPAPEVLAHVPLIGRRLVSLWQHGASDLPALLDRSEGALMLAGRALVVQFDGLATALAELGYAILLAFQVLAAGPPVQRSLRRLARALGGPAGEAALGVMAGAISVVAYRILGWALVEALLCFLGFWALDLPLAPVLGLACFVMRLLQIGPWPVWIAALLWCWLVEAAPGQAFALGGWAALIVLLGRAVDRRQGDRMPVPRPVLFLAVLGGLLAWGFTGMFLGAAAVSVAWTLGQQWIAQEEAQGRG